jgi:hypothetical protein
MFRSEEMVIVNTIVGFFGERGYKSTYAWRERYVKE